MPYEILKIGLKTLYSKNFPFPFEAKRGAVRFKWRNKIVKEQLAAMTIIELVRTAHSYATSIQQIDTHSAIVREMASRLEALNIAYIRAMNIIRSAKDDRSQQQGITFVSADELSAVLARVQGLHEISVDLIAEDVFKQHEASTTDAWQREQQSQAIRAALDECSDYLDTDCVMERLDISYKDAEKRTSGAMELHHALVTVANRLRNGEAI